jgi:ATP-binding cassette subfamily B protein
VLGGIRNVILDNAHNFFINSYKKIDFKLRSAIAGNLFYGQFPRHVIEAGVLFAFIIGSLYIQSSPNYNFIDLIPILGALALAAIKLLPNIQQIYRSWSTIKGAHANFEDVINILEMNDSVIKKDISSIKKFEELEFKKVSFGYGQKTPLIFSEIDLKILKGERVGIVGATGGGKSTLIDIFMGLLDPTSGEVRINNFPIKDILNSWQGLISVVPQEIFICEGNFYENIAFGVPYEEIKLDKVIEAARNAELFSFISSQKDSFDTHIYENGSNLSGGQKQRIAIARALYKESEFIIFDEATSALDDETEKRVMESIKLLNKNNITIIMIAHRLSTLESCDIILEISNNKYQKYNSINDYKVRKKT